MTGTCSQTLLPLSMASRPSAVNCKLVYCPRISSAFPPGSVSGSPYIAARSLSAT